MKVFRIFLLALPLLLTACPRSEEKTPPAPPRAEALFQSYDGYLRRRLAALPGAGLSEGMSAEALGEARARTGAALCEALGIDPKAPPGTGRRLWRKSADDIQIEGWRISTSEREGGDVPALLYLPKEGAPSAAVVLAPGTGQNKHDFLSQLACGHYVRGGAACLALDVLGEGERSAVPLERGRGLLQDDALARAADVGRPVLGTQVQDLRRGLSFFEEHPRTKNLPRAVAGYSLGGWSALLTGAIDERPRLLIAASTLVVPSEIGGDKGGGWRVGGVREAARLEELLALAATGRTVLWVNGAADKTFIADAQSRARIEQQIASKATTLVGETGTLSHTLVPQGPHLPYHFTPPALEFLVHHEFLPRYKIGTILATKPYAPEARLAEIAKTINPMQWPASLIRAAYVPLHAPLLAAKDLLVGGEPFETLPQWLARAERGARLPTSTFQVGFADRLRRGLDRDFNALLSPQRWRVLENNIYQDNLTGLRAYTLKGDGEGWLLFFPKARALDEPPTPPGEKFAHAIVFESLRYSDNESAAGTTAAGQSTAAALALLERKEFAAVEGYRVVGEVDDVALYLALLDSKAAAIELRAKGLMEKALTGFHLEGHVSGVTGVIPREVLLGKLVPRALTLYESVEAPETIAQARKAYAEHSQQLTILP